jgi:hypothetical protein
MKKILKGIYSQKGYCEKTGLSAGRISQLVKAEKLTLVYTEDGKPLIKA